MLPCRPDIFRIFDAARLTGATDMRRDATDSATSSGMTAIERAVACSHRIDTNIPLKAYSYTKAAQHRASVLHTAR
jgi:hypothetical protein